MCPSLRKRLSDGSKPPSREYEVVVAAKSTSSASVNSNKAISRPDPNSPDTTG
jgi:hypothetical protein